MKATVSFLLMFAVLFVSVRPALAQDDKVERALVKAHKDAERTAVRDANGKLIQMEIEYFGPMQTLELGYDQDTLSSITLGDGTKMTILYNEKGKFEGVVFPNGSKAIFLWEKVSGLDFSLPAGLKLINPSGKETILPLTASPKEKESASLSKIAFSLDEDCQYAVAAAAAASVNAAVACGSGSATCVTATAIAVVAIANAVRICRRIGDIEPIEV